MQKTVGNRYNNHYQNKGRNHGTNNHYQNNGSKNNNKGNEPNHIQPVNTDYNILNDLKDYMLDNKNILQLPR